MVLTGQAILALHIHPVSYSLTTCLSSALLNRDILAFTDLFDLV